MNYFFDESIPPKAASLVEVFDRESLVEAHVDVFVSGTPDVDWLRELGERNPKPVVVTFDSRILRNKVERQALRDADLSFVAFAGGWAALSWEDQAWKLLKAWPLIRSALKATRQPVILEVSVNGKVERVDHSR